MSLVARASSHVSSSTSVSPVRTSYGYQNPGKSVESDDRSEKPEKPSPPGYSKEDYGQSWSSQEWKSGAAEHDRSGKPEKNLLGYVVAISALVVKNLFSTEMHIP